jgi:hypothetical protein
MTSNTSSDRVPEERVAAILKRAAELDRKVRETVDRDAIRTAAVEAGIRLESVELALDEYEAGLVDSPPVAVAAEQPQPAGGFFRRWARRLVDPVMIGGLGLVTGWLTALGEAGFFIPLIALIFVGGRIVLRDRPSHSARAFVRTFSGMALAVLFGALMVEADEDLIAFLVTAAVTLLAGGTAAIKWVRAEEMRLGTASKNGV